MSAYPKHFQRNISTFHSDYSSKRVSRVFLRKWEGFDSSARNDLDRSRIERTDREATRSRRANSGSFALSLKVN